MKYDFIIIGSGLGGLLTGLILSKEGYNVCVLEKNARIGGCLQSFKRNGAIFNTGLNYTESLLDGQIMNQYFEYFGIRDKLNLKRMDIDAFEKITFNDDPIEYKYAQGTERFIENMVEQFPQERRNIVNYMNELEKLSNSFPLYNLDIKTESSILNEYYYKDTAAFINSITTNQKLRNVLVGTSPLYAGVPDKTPLYIHGLIVYSFIQSAWRVVDGSSLMAETIADEIVSNGGTVMKSSEVISINTDNRKVNAIELNSGEKIEARTFISAIHPEVTLNLIDDKTAYNAFRKRINSLENTSGMFTLYAVMKDGSFPYINHNHYHYAVDNVWDAVSYTSKEWPPYYLLYTPAVSGNSEYSKAVIVITYMHYDEVKKWSNTKVGRRGEEYEDFKRRKAEQLIGKVEEKYSGFSASIDKYYSSTPLTYRDYTATIDGSSYGIMKDYRNPMKSLILPKSKFPNLYFTGQNLNLHGILGVTVNAVMTCSEFLGIDNLLNKIKNY